MICFPLNGNQEICGGTLKKKKKGFITQFGNIPPMQQQRKSLLSVFRET